MPVRAIRSPYYRLAAAYVAALGLLLTMGACSNVLPHAWTAPLALYDAEGVWTDDQGRRIRLGDLRGRNVVLSMFYRTCDISCPLTLARMKDLQQALAERHQDARFVLVSLDPRHDTPENLAAYRQEHGLDAEHWTLLTGAIEPTLALSQALDIHRLDDFSHLVHFVKIAVIRSDGERMKLVEGRDLGKATDFLAGSQTSP
ncbi:SCO family protein [Methylococcus sp. EFPC2]|uniref:SCO family protein n=1 Tax=Methylococcus sp. EFPC2 TaxID=2812648 RepID=UPI0019679A25|nr:SCO family protein [Methylococcus sp. EFPC2]QSA96031.1 SCO family protein [Methylococcus sp. EFPC2]